MNRLRNYSLSIVLFSLFFVCLLLQGFLNYSEWYSGELMHTQTPELQNYWVFFGGRIFENLQSEFMQLFAFVILSAWLIHRGSPQSKDGDLEMQAEIEKIRTTQAVMLHELSALNLMISRLISTDIESVESPVSRLLRNRARQQTTKHPVVIHSEDQEG